MYDGLTFRLSLKFTSEYPFKPPTVRFEVCPLGGRVGCSAVRPAFCSSRTPARHQCLDAENPCRRAASTPMLMPMDTSAWTSSRTSGAVRVLAQCKLTL